MMKRIYFFVLIFLLMFKMEIFAQLKWSKDSISYPAISINKKLYIQQGNADTLIRQLPVLNFTKPLTSSFYINNLGYFCKKELQIQKLTSVPVRFRLGSLDYVNYLEQKPNALKPR